MQSDRESHAFECVPVNFVNFRFLAYIVNGDKGWFSEYICFVITKHLYGYFHEDLLATYTLYKWAATKKTWRA